MALIEETALIEAGFLRRRCSEDVDYVCPVCGTSIGGAAALPLVDLNCASRDELDQLPGIGDIIASRIINHRPFGSVADLKKIKGIRDSLFKKLEPLVTVNAGDIIQTRDCPTCMRPVLTPNIQCVRCKQNLPAGIDGQERDCFSIQAYRTGHAAPAFAPDEPLWVFKRSAGNPDEVAAESDLRRRFRSGELDATALVRLVAQDAFVKADACPKFRGVARPPLPSAVKRPRPVSAPRREHRDASAPSPTPIPVVPPAPVTRPRPESSRTPITPASLVRQCWHPAAVGWSAFVSVFLAGWLRSAISFMGSQIDNLVMTFVGAAGISFVIYSLACGIRGRGHPFMRTTLLGGFLWLSTGIPSASEVVAPESGSHILIKTIFFRWFASFAKDDRAAILGLSLFVMPVFAGLMGAFLMKVGSNLAALGNRLILEVFVLLFTLWMVFPEFLK